VQVRAVQLMKTFAMITDPPNRCANNRQQRAAACVVTRPQAAWQTERLFAIRELLTSDAPACEAFVQHLDRQDLRMRFASLISSRAA
jgi:hypothetical protein